MAGLLTHTPTEDLLDPRLFESRFSDLNWVDNWDYWQLNRFEDGKSIPIGYVVGSRSDGT